MPKFRIIRAVSIRRVYDVEAEDEDEAQEFVEDRLDDPDEEFDVRSETIEVKRLSDDGEELEDDDAD